MLFFCVFSNDHVWRKEFRKKYAGTISLYWSLVFPIHETCFRDVNASLTQAVHWERLKLCKGKRVAVLWLCSIYWHRSAGRSQATGCHLSFPHHVALNTRITVKTSLVTFSVLRFRGNVRAISNVIQLLVPILVKTEVDKGHNSLIWWYWQNYHCEFTSGCHALNIRRSELILIYIWP